jgi:hypothetical protein
MNTTCGANYEDFRSTRLENNLNLVASLLFYDLNAIRAPAFAEI